MKSQSFRNGKRIDNAIATDRSFLYGDGVFTSIAVNQGQPLFLKQHLARLAADCQTLKITNIPLQKIEKQILSTAHEVDQAIIRLTISRSSGSRGYLCVDPEPIYWLSIDDWPLRIEHYRQQGINVRYCEQRLALDRQLAGVKHCNRLKQVIARNEWTTENFQEGLMLDTQDNVIEGTMSNLFIIENHSVLTPDLTFSGVAGIMRNRIIGMLQHMNVPIVVTVLSRQQIAKADALFVSNSVIGIWPINQLESHHFNRHPLLQRIQEQLQDEFDKQSIQ